MEIFTKSPSLFCSSDANECAGSPCVNAVSCRNLVGDYVCQCQAGWRGKKCEKNVNDCRGQCQHGATCIDLVNDYHCACLPGFSGRHCAHNIDECASNPCKNGGQCVDLINSNKCICTVGYVGQQCEVRPNLIMNHLLDHLIELNSTKKIWWIRLLDHRKNTLKTTKMSMQDCIKS